MIGFSVKEGWRNFRELGIYGLLTLISMTVTLVFVGVSARSYLTINSWRDGLLTKFEIEAYLLPDSDSTQIRSLEERILSIGNIQGVRFISKQDAARRFIEQFGSGILELLEYNPLPASFVIRLENVDNLSRDWEAVAAELISLDGIGDVVYEGELLSILNRFYLRFGKLAVGLTAVMFFISFTFTVLTVVGEIRSREEFIRVVALCGGSRAMARGPFLVMGAYYGLFSGVVALLIVAAVGWTVEMLWGIPATIPPVWVTGLPVLGVIIGVLGAGWTVGRRMRWI